MIRVLIVAEKAPARPNVFAAALRQFAEAGAQVSLIGGFAADEAAGLARPAVPAGTAGLGGTTGFAMPAGTAGLGGTAGLVTVTTLVPGRRGTGTAGEALWRRFRGDAAARRAAARADVLVALDPAAVHTVWQLGRRHRGAVAVLGLAPALRAVEAYAAHRARYAVRRLLVHGPTAEFAVEAARGQTLRQGERALRAAAGARVHRLSVGRAAWQLALRLPMPARARVPLSGRVAESLTRAGYPDQAAETLTGTAGRMPQLRARAGFLAGAAKRDLDQGRSPAYLNAAVTAQLAVADAAYTAGDAAVAARAVRRATGLLFHRGLHLDAVESPAAPQPMPFLAPWHDSAVGRALGTPRGRASAAVSPRERPHRILFLYLNNDNFLGEIQRRYADRDDTEVRGVNIIDDDVLRDAARNPEGLVEHLLAGSSAYGDRVAEAFRPHLEWADTAWVDWCTHTAGLLTAVDPGTTRIVVRLHSVEAFTEWPQLIDASRIDDLVFVSEHLRDYTLAAAPRLGGPGGPRTPVLVNAMDLSGYDRPKPDAARFTVGLVGISSIAKDPSWAVRVLTILRRQDGRYRLLLIGSDLDGRHSQAGRQYQRTFEAELRELEPTGAVRRYGQTDDVPAALTEVGVILSSSVRESFHCGLVEGAASQAVPVVRDWPFFRGGPHGARTVFPPEWVVGTPEEAAERILATTSSDELWRKTGAEAAAHAMATWDWAMTAPAYDRLILGA